MISPLDKSDEFCFGLAGLSITKKKPRSPSRRRPLSRHPQQQQQQLLLQHRHCSCPNSEESIANESSRTAEAAIVAGCDYPAKHEKRRGVSAFAAAGLLLLSERLPHKLTEIFYVTTLLLSFVTFYTSMSVLTPPPTSSSAGSSKGSAPAAASPVPPFHIAAMMGMMNLGGSARAKTTWFPRIVFYFDEAGGLSEQFESTANRTVPDYLLFDDGPTSGEQQDEDEEEWSDGPAASASCVPMKEWQAQPHPSCNRLHEIDLTRKPSLLGWGGTRVAWRVRRQFWQDRDFVLRTHGWYRNFQPKHYMRQLVDALVSERLTSSPHVIDIYGYCGTASINERGQSLEWWNLWTPMENLVWVMQMAEGIADIHDVDGEGNTTIVHRNIKIKNFLVVQGKLKINDFDEAKLLMWDVDRQHHCPFRVQERLPYYPQYDPPVDTVPPTDAIDIFALGGIIYDMLLHQRKPFDGWSKNMIRYKYAKREVPVMSSRLTLSLDPSIVAMLRAFERCFTFSPEDRPSARNVAKELNSTLQALLQIKQ